LAISKSDYNARKARIEIEEIARMKSEWSLKWVQERSRTTDSTPIKVILDSNKKLLPNLYAVNRNVAAIIGGIPSFDVAGMSGFLVDPPRGFRPIRIAHPDICFVSGEIGLHTHSPRISVIFINGGMAWQTDSN